MKNGFAEIDHKLGKRKKYLFDLSKVKIQFDEQDASSNAPRMLPIVTWDERIRSSTFSNGPISNIQSDKEVENFHKIP